MRAAFRPIYPTWPHDIDRLAEECADTEILINNAGAIPGGDIAAIDEARWREAWDLKVFGYINMTRRFYALIWRGAHGVIVNISVRPAKILTSTTSPGASGNASLMAFTPRWVASSPPDNLPVVGINPARS